MKTCPNCRVNYDDQTMFCSICGAHVVNAEETEETSEHPGTASEEQASKSKDAENEGGYSQPEQQHQNYQQSNSQFGYQQPNAPYSYQPYGYQQPYYPPVDYSDHTMEFAPEEVSQYKLYAAACYLLGILGVALCALINRDSKYLQFHMKENMKLFILDMIITLIGIVLCFTIIVPFAAGICGIILLVVQIIGFVNTCRGKSKELPIVSSFKFLK